MIWGFQNEFFQACTPSIAFTRVIFQSVIPTVRTDKRTRTPPLIIQHRLIRTRKCLICGKIDKINQSWSAERYRLVSGGNPIRPFLRL